MFIIYSTERPYHNVPEDEVLRTSFFGLSNKYFDPGTGSRLLNEYIDEKLYAEELGFDGFMLNEHHGTPFCMGGVQNVEAAVLARVTRKGKIVLLGNPLPVNGNPLRLAEELAEIDLLSGGRLVSGWVRGTGCESIFNGTNPALNREYFLEAHELIVKAWTTPGPFRFEGKHFHYRHVNPWVLPLQKPHPPIWVPGILSPESVEWAARKRYPYIALSTGIEATSEMWKIYSKAAAEEGYQAGPECFGYIQVVFLAETEKKANELGKGVVFGNAWRNFGRPEWMFPPGYNSRAAAERMARLNLPMFKPENAGTEQAIAAPSPIDVEAEKRQYYGEGYELAKKFGFVLVGTPKTVIPRLKNLIQVLRPGILSINTNDGPIPREARLTSMRLIAEEVLPALREEANKLGLVDPFQRAPGARPLPASGQPDPVLGEATAG